ncbi:MAG: hypothetical protein GY838_12275 [bacterium]|nr:hypothetical protein [bacterium]
MERPRLRFPLVLSILVVVLGAAVLPTAAAAQTARPGRMPILWRDWTQVPATAGRSVVAAEERRQAAVRDRWHQVHEMVGAAHVSTRAQDELARRGLGPALLDKSFTGAAATWDGLDTLRVLIIRIGFQENRSPSLTTVVPGGDFELAPLPDREDTLYVDPPPHDKAYVEAHLRGLSEYYRYQSGGRLHIEGRVLPEGDQDSYKLSDIADYGPGKNGSWSLEKLEKLVRDVIVLADTETQADGSAVLADYDDDDPLAYVIFMHAGSDFQSDINNDSPNDIPTFFVNLGEAQALTSMDTDSGAPGSLTDCSVIPETTNQDGYAGSIAAAFYHEFGHALGLPDVYSTRSGGPQVGVWDLMDSGTNLPVPLGFVNSADDTIQAVATGVLPPSLSAWNKWYLGWLVTEDANNSPDGHRLPAVQVMPEQYEFYRGGPGGGGFDANDPQAVRAGMSSREWFLMENRWVPGGPGETPWQELYLKKDPDTGVILYLASDEPGEDAVNTGLYDYFLPAGGLLVWHVNMDRIQSGMEDNTINYYDDGLRLVEADGIQDIGVFDSYVVGWTGSLLDPFGGYWYTYTADGVQTTHYNNFKHLYADGFPNTRCFDRSWTGLTVTGVQNLGLSRAMLTFRAELEPLLPNFPFEVAAVDSAHARAIDPRSVTVVDVDGQPALIFADAAPENWEGLWSTGLYGVRPGGGPRWPGPDIERLGMFLYLDEAQVGLRPGPLAGPPVAWTEPDGSGRLLVGTVNGELAYFPMGDLVRVPDWTVDLGDTLTAAPVVLDLGDTPYAVATPVGTDRLAVLDLDDGTPLATELVLSTVGLGPVTLAGDLRVLPNTGAGTDHVLVVTDAGWMNVMLGSGLVATGWGAWPRAAVGRIHSAHVTDAEGSTLGFFDDEGLLSNAHRTGGASLATWDTDEPLVAEPAVADLNGDGRDDVILATSRRILAYQQDGVMLNGWPRPLRDIFPLPDSTRIRGPLVVIDADGDGANEVIFGTDGGHLFSLDATGRLRGRTPLRWGDGLESAFALQDAEEPGEGRVLWLATSGGTVTSPLPRQVNNGRIGAFILGPEADVESHTSEWRGTGGDARRRGSVGLARDLGNVGTVSAEYDRAIVYPNPLREDDLVVRFYSAGTRDARFAVHNLEGEVVVRATIPVTVDAVNEHRLSLAGLASGLYVCTLQWDAPGGRETRTMTLAVEK